VRSPLPLTFLPPRRRYYITYRRWKANLRQILVNENKIDDVAIITTELSGLRRDFKEMLFTTTVDLEDRMDRRMLRLLKEIHEQGSLTAERRMTMRVKAAAKPDFNLRNFEKDLKAREDADFKRRLTKLISRLPEDAVKESVANAQEHKHTEAEQKELEHLENRFAVQHELDTTVIVPEKSVKRDRVGERSVVRSAKRDAGGDDTDLSSTTVRRKSITPVDVMELESLEALADRGGATQG
jgi:hypothetical protein